jgi:hypothetical protein
MCVCARRTDSAVCQFTYTVSTMAAKLTVISPAHLSKVCLFSFGVNVICNILIYSIMIFLYVEVPVNDAKLLRILRLKDILCDLTGKLYLLLIMFHRYESLEIISLFSNVALKMMKRIQVL